jgi:hypothetical protein
MSKRQIKFTGRTESEVEQKFQRWIQDSGGNVFNVVRGDIVESAKFMWPPRMPWRNIGVPDAYSMQVTYETKPKSCPGRHNSRAAR